ncbi:hypothetical protein RhiirB3_397560 [Rhizophagus irregularis]|nr:hypothetical protein RhiirB3_397560 [Rhizophagus irregularis]
MTLNMDITGICTVDVVKVVSAIANSNAMVLIIMKDLYLLNSTHLPHCCRRSLQKK